MFKVSPNSRPQDRGSTGMSTVFKEMQGALSSYIRELFIFEHLIILFLWYICELARLNNPPRFTPFAYCLRISHVRGINKACIILEHILWTYLTWNKRHSLKLVYTPFVGGQVWYVSEQCFITIVHGGDEWRLQWCKYWLNPACSDNVTKHFRNSFEPRSTQGKAESPPADVIHRRCLRTRRLGNAISASGQEQLYNAAFPIVNQLVSSPALRLHRLWWSTRRRAAKLLPAALRLVDSSVRWPSSTSLPSTALSYSL